MVGIDVGLKDLFVTDTGFRSGNPRHVAKYAARPGTTPAPVKQRPKAQKNRAKARLKVCGPTHAKIADCRLDALHKASRKLINDNRCLRRIP